MIDLTPLDVRKKRGDFRRGIRGYERQEVDSFLELVAERLEEVVRENLQMRERVQSLQQQTAAQTQREEAVRDALVTAQELRAEIREQARVEADRIVQEAHTEARRMIAEAEAEVRTRLRNSERQADHAVATLGVLERRRLRFLQSFRQLLERELDVVEVEEGRPPLEERSFDLNFGGGSSRADRGARPDPYALPDPDYEDGEPATPRPDAGGGPEDDGTAGIAEQAATDGDEEQGGSRPRRTENLLLYLEPDEEADERD